MKILNDRITGGSKATIDPPADQIGQPSDLFNKVSAFAFDVLGVQMIELQAREAEMPVHRANAGHWLQKRPPYSA